MTDFNKKEYEIKDKELIDGVSKYLICWKDGSHSIASLSSLTGCGDTLLHFEARRACNVDIEDRITYYRFIEENGVFIQWKKGKSKIITLDPAICSHLKSVLSKEGVVDIGSRIESFMIKPSGPLNEKHMMNLCPDLLFKYRQQVYTPVQLNIQNDGDGGLCDMGDVVVMDKESSMYPYLSLSLTKGIKQLILPMKVRIEHFVEESFYREDVTISQQQVNTRDALLLDATQNKIICNIELKTTVSNTWRLISLNDLAETILYSKYYVQTKQADNALIAVLTDLHSWHVFSLKYSSTEKFFHCIGYYTAQTQDINGVHGIVCALLRLLQKVYL